MSKEGTKQLCDGVSWLWSNTFQHCSERRAGAAEPLHGVRGRVSDGHLKGAPPRSSKIRIHMVPEFIVTSGRRGKATLVSPLRSLGVKNGKVTLLDVEKVYLGANPVDKSCGTNEAWREARSYTMSLSQKREKKRLSRSSGDDPAAGWTKL